MVILALCAFRIYYKQSPKLSPNSLFCNSQSQERRRCNYAILYLDKEQMFLMQDFPELPNYETCYDLVYFLRSRQRLLQPFLHLLKVTGHSKIDFFCRVSSISTRLFFNVKCTFKRTSIRLFRFKISESVPFLIKNPQNLLKICKRGQIVKF